MMKECRRRKKVSIDSRKRRGGKQEDEVRSEAIGPLIGKPLWPLVSSPQLTADPSNNPSLRYGLESESEPPEQYLWHMPRPNAFQVGRQRATSKPQLKDIDMRLGAHLEKARVHHGLCFKPSRPSPAPTLCLVLSLDSCNRYYASYEHARTPDNTIPIFRRFTSKFVASAS